VGVGAECGACQSFGGRNPVPARLACLGAARAGHTRGRRDAQGGGCRLRQLSSAQRPWVDEGHIAIPPPIAGPYLFVPRGKGLAPGGHSLVDTVRINHEAYSDESLARAIREGIGANGKTLNLSDAALSDRDATMAELIDYLKGIKVSASPGVSTAVLHFATIITPDADPVKRRGMLAVMDQYFVDKNNRHGAYQGADSVFLSHTMFRVERRWQLHVWELAGAPATWEAQLRRHLAAEPVFAVILGSGVEQLGPVQNFCEEQSLPCLFPNVEAPTGHDSDFYSVYFSRGVLLEAQLIARELADAAEPAHRVVQVFRAGDVGVQAARDLQAARAHSGQQSSIASCRRMQHRRDLGAALRDVGAAEALVLWLRPGDLRRFGESTAAHVAVWISGEMGGLEQGAAAGQLARGRAHGLPRGPSRATRGACRLRAQLVSHPQDPAPRPAGAGGHLSRLRAGVGDPETTWWMRSCGSI